MHVKNFQLLKAYNQKEQRLHTIELKQKSILDSLRKRYSELKLANDSPPTPAEKFITLKRIHNLYTFKLHRNEIGKQRKSDNEAHEKIKSGRLSKLSSHTLAQNETRTKMLTAGNLYTTRNRASSVNINKPATAKSSREIKSDMLKRAKEFGNRYLATQRRQHPLRSVEVERNAMYDRRRYHELLRRKSELEKNFNNSIRFNRRMPEDISLNYLNTLDEICSLEALLNIENRIQDSEICYEILQLNKPEDADEQLINELKRPNFHQLEVSDDRRSMFRAIGSVDMAELLKASTAIQTSVAKVEEYDPYDIRHVLNQQEIQAAENVDGTEQTAVENEDDAFKSCVNTSTGSKRSSRVTLCSDDKITTNVSDFDSIENIADKCEKLLSSNEICKYDSSISIHSTVNDAFAAHKMEMCKHNCEDVDSVGSADEYSILSRSLMCVKMNKKSNMLL